MSELADWSTFAHGDGVIVAADITQEWLLPWWWEHYRKHNSYPVAFIDFGMSFEKKKWCQERGCFLSFPLCSDLVKEEKEVDLDIVGDWNQNYGILHWDSRYSWFKKPFACLKTPFERTLWIDIDCEIRASIEPLFSFGESFPFLSLAREQVSNNKPYPLYSSGVIAFRHKAALIAEWAKSCLEHTGKFYADDIFLSYLLDKKGIAILEIPPTYNWSRCQKDLSRAHIVHWHGAIGKSVLKSRIHLDSLDFY